MPEVSRTIALGFDRGERSSTLLDGLRLQGYDLIAVPAAGDLPGALERAPHVPILAYKGPDVEVRQVLAMVRGAPSRSPVIVLVDHSEFREYYELMCAGVYDYFEVGDRPEWIARALQGAASWSLEAASGIPEGTQPNECAVDELTRQQLASAIQQKICAMCPDRNVDGSCNRLAEGSCTLFAKLPEAVEAILKVWSERMGPYIQSVRDHVCAQCRLRNPDGSCDLRQTDNCMLDSYLPLVVEAVEERFGRDFSSATAPPGTGGQTAPGSLCRK